MDLETAKSKFLRVVRRGLAAEKAWDKAAKTGDTEKMKKLEASLPAYDRAVEKYEALGLRAVMRKDGPDIIFRKDLVTGS